MSHPAIDSALYFSGLPATYFINKTCALWGRGTAAPSRFPACTGRSDAKAPRRIESLRAVSCYNEIITGCRQIVNEKTQFCRDFRHFFAHLSLGDFISVWGGFCRSVLLLILLRPLVVVGLLAAPLGEVEGHEAADPAGKADEKYHHRSDGDAGRISGGDLLLRLLYLSGRLLG